jgi:hypothetical protein
MSAEIAELEARIQALGVEERVELMRIRIADGDGVADANVESAWLEEAQRRQQERIEGKVQGGFQVSAFSRIFVHASGDETVRLEFHPEAERELIEGGPGFDRRERLAG